MKVLFTVYRPIKVDDGEGGFTTEESVGDDLEGFMEVHMSEVRITGVDRDEDVNVNDIVEIAQ